MGHRNTLCPNQMHDLDMGQRGPGYFHPQPCFQLGGVSTIIQPNFHPPVAVSVNASTFEGHHLPEHHLTAPNFYAPYMQQVSGNGMLHVPLNYGSSDHSSTSANNHGNVGLSADENGRHGPHGQLMDASHKTKHAEGNSHNINASASSSSSVIPSDTRNPDGAAASYGMPQYVGNGSSSTRNRSGTLGMEPNPAHNYYPMLQGNYMGQPFAPSGLIWFDPQASCRDGVTSDWTQVHARPYMHGNSVIGGSMDTSVIAGPRYHETANNRTSTNFMAPPPPINLRHPSIPPVAAGLTGHNINYLPPAAAGAAAYRLPTTYVSRSTVPSQDGMNMGPMAQPVTIAPPGLRMFRPQPMGVVPPEVQVALRSRSLPQLRVMPSDGVAMLELPHYYQMGNFIDHHRDMRLDIEHMSYEELLALEEQIGSVNTGLSQETVGSQLKTRTYSSSASCINSEQSSDSCIICQEEYKNKEKLGILNCGHEYHSDCLTKWLLSKNVCPICKCEAMKTESKQ